MAERKQEPISQTRVRTNRLRAITTADAAERRATPAAPRLQPTQEEISAMNMAGLQGMTMLPGFVPAQRRSQTSSMSDADWIKSEAANLGLTPYTGEYRGGPTVPAAPAAPAAPSYVAPTFSPISSANPYLDYQRGLTAMADQASANFGNELADIQNRYKSLRDQVMAQFGNTKNPELLAARDIALAELGRQADDATKQVAANYQAAQADQVRFAEQQKALGAELGAQNAILANVAAGNIAAYADQAGLTDSAAQDTAAFLASQAPRQQALASALGLSGGMFQSAMGTSLGEQQMAIQGQIARDLAARQGQVSTSTAQQIAAAAQADREAQRQAYLNLVMDEMSALDRARGTMTERDFALRQAILQGGVEAGRFAAEQDRYNRDAQMRQEEQAYNRWLADQELALKRQDIEWERKYKQDLLDIEAGKKGASISLTPPPAVKSLGAGYAQSKGKSPNAGATVAAMEQLGAVMAAASVAGGYSADETTVVLDLWSTISSDPAAVKYLNERGIYSPDDFSRLAVPTTTASRTAADYYYGSRPR